MAGSHKPHANAVLIWLVLTKPHENAVLIWLSHKPHENAVLIWLVLTNHMKMLS